ncbi:MAG: flippase-like domain-containing protein [Clostridiales bacterium]|nr:flippase-like domain-containing protein [Clostridiales bacterium]
MSSKVSKRTKKLIINISILLVLTGITLLILFLSYRDLDFNEIWEALKKSTAWSIAAAFGCMLLFIFFEGLSLWVITRRLGHKTKLVGAMAYSSADAYYSAITPSASGGQPASMYYMVRDGMSGGVAGFSLVFNIMAYTAAAIVMGLFAFIVRPGMFGSLTGWAAPTLLIVGFVLQVIVLGFFIMCIMWSNGILKLGNAGITLLRKIKIIKHEDKWRAKWKAGVEKYSASRHIIKEHPTLFLWALLLNLAQRVSQTLIPCFVCYAMAPDSDFLDLFVMQVFVLLGYNMIPSPGGTGFYEIMYLNTYNSVFSDAFILTAMMISRAISYYACIIVSGIYTLVYHSLGLKGKDAEKEPPELDNWQYSMYSEGEEWCEGETATVMRYSEGEAGESAVIADYGDEVHVNTEIPVDQADEADGGQPEQGGNAENAQNGGIDRQEKTSEAENAQSGDAADGKGVNDEVRE